MKNTSSFLDKVPGSGWQVLAELKLAIAPEAKNSVKGWLIETLGTFKLPEDVLRRVTNSAQQAVARVTMSEYMRMEFEHIHIHILISKKDTSLLHSGQGWGFFRVERVGTSAQDRNSNDHLIEFYLYLDGQ
jgi:hypothetical protein